jgi:hypothetical protein
MLMVVKNPSRLLIGAQLLLALAYTLPLFSSQLLADSDFVSFYTAFEILHDGQGARLYDLELQRHYQEELRVTLDAPSNLRFLPFVNPPHAGLLLRSIPYLSPKSAAFVFLGFNCLVGIWVLRRLWQLASDWTTSARVLLITTVLGTDVFFYGLATRTITLIVFACLIEYYRALKDHRDVGAAVWLVAATAKPQLIFLPGFIPLILHRWRLVVIAVSLGLLLALCISLVVGFHVWSDYATLLREVSINGAAYGASSLQMNNLRMILVRILPDALVLPVVYLALVVGMASTFWIWRSLRACELKFALTLLLGLFLAPHLNYQDTLLTFLPASIIYDHARLKNQALTRVFRWLVPIATLIPAALIFSGYSRTFRWIWPVAFVLILIALCVRALRAEHGD